MAAEDERYARLLCGFARIVIKTPGFAKLLMGHGAIAPEDRLVVTEAIERVERAGA
jgi:hypothetical protein